MSEKLPYRSPLSLKLIRWLCRAELFEEIEGNLIEYQLQNDLVNRRFSKLKYWFEVFNYIRPSTLKKFNYSKNNSMFIFNPLLTIRNLRKQGSSTLINILGFALGLICVFILYFHIQSEMSYDSFHADKDQIHRTVRLADFEGVENKIGVTSGPYAPALLNDYPNNIQSVCRAFPENGFLSFGEKKIYEDKVLFADANFFDFFSYPLLSGEKSQVLKEVNSVVLDKISAKKYFGDLDPIGKIMRLDDRWEFMVTGIMDDLPAKTHLDFNMVFQIGVLEQQSWFDQWWNNGLVTYTKINTPEEAGYVNSQLPDFMEKYFGADFAASGFKMGLELEPLTDIYFNKDTTFDVASHGNINNVYILGLVALAILFIASFNYLNLTIAQSFKRAKEIAIRKVLGGSKLRLVLQFLGESFTILIFSSLIAIGATELLKTSFNNLFQLDIRLNWLDPNVVVLFAVLISTTLVLAGLYPALQMSSMGVTKVLKGWRPGKGKNVFLRKGLVMTQFIISIFMIASTLFINEQMKFIRKKDLGFNKEAVVLIDINNNSIRQNIDAFKEALSGQPRILSVTSASGEPGGFHDATLIKESGRNETEALKVRTLLTDENYLKTFQVKLLMGRDFSRDLETDQGQTVIINRKTLNLLGYSAEEVLDKQISLTSWNLENLRVIGVVEDFNFTSLKDQIEPLVIINGLRHRKFAAKVDASNLQKAMAELDQSWKQFSPDFPMQFDFLDESIAKLYLNEAKQNRLFSWFSGISIFLACMGIFGLVTYTAKQRQKELGIRKVLGASVRQIIGLISREFVMLISISSIVAIPIVWYFMDGWLNDFAYKISISNNWLLFIASGVAVGIIALITISLKTYRTAVSNPTESIRYE